VGITKRFTNKELISASKERDAHVQNLVANEVFLLPIAKVFVPRLAYYTLLETPDVFRLYVIAAELFVAPASISPIVPFTANCPRTAPHTPASWDHLVIYGLYVLLNHGVCELMES
jgi:hypothetical protein